MSQFTTITVVGYGAVVICLWLAVGSLTDRVWPATLVAFGPRWFAGLPLLPLVLIAVTVRPGAVALKLLGVLALTCLVLIFGFMDFRMGLERMDGTPVLRIMTHNVGEGHITAEALDRLMKAERVDVATLQECPFYNDDMARLGWHFYYGGDLCLVSRYPFVVLDERVPEEKWRRGSNEPDRFEIEAGTWRFQLLNVHLGTIRGGLEAMRDGRWRALPLFADNRKVAELQSRAARGRIRQETEPMVVAGDFNLPVESAIYREDWGDFRNAFSSCGHGFGHTKFTSLYGIRIDQVLTSGGWGCSDARVLSSPYGGDHAPLVVDLVIPN